MIETEDAQGRLKGRNPVGVIDIGSNSVRLVLYEGLVRSPAILFNEKVSCGLGRGIAATNRMDDGAVEEALEALVRFRALADQIGVGELYIVATAAAREAENGPEFVEKAERILRQPIHILTGLEEAHFSAQGIISAFRAPDGIAGDLGGGSLELVDINGDLAGTGITMPLGVIRLGERAEASFPTAEKITRKDIKSADILDTGKGRVFYAVGGTWRNIAKLHISSTNYPLHVTHSYEVEPEELLKFLDKIKQGNLDKFEGISDVSNSRRALLPYGAIVLTEVIKRMEPSKIVFSSSGLREGYLYAQLDEETQRADALYEAAGELAILRARSPRHARELAEWTAYSFEKFGIDESVDEKRYRDAACLLADIGWRAHADYRAMQSLAILAYGSFVQVDHQGRAYIALSNYFRYEGLKNESLAPEIRNITTDRIWERSRLLGGFMRVAYLFTAAMPGVMSNLEWEQTGDKEMMLTLPESLRALAGERPSGRINQLSKVTGWKISVSIRP
ncbi:Ppx/GppA phosphatase family protein [Ahrensia kielensis]|uniref:Ppx/GppA phosphatase family protein n=1 Tax=Ahrensia kielensis TaxID=76980 RepID=A0ABU9T364_9HYPH